MKRLISILLVLGLAGCDKQPEDPDVIARIGSQTIDVEEFQRTLDRQAARNPQAFDEPAEREALLAALVDRKLMVEAAYRQGLHEDPDVREAIDQVYASRVRRQLEERVVAEATVTDDEVRAHYEAHIGDYQRPERRQVAILQSESTREADRARLEQVRTEVIDGDQRTTHFGALAIEHSDDQSSRYRGGVIGWLTADMRGRYRWPDTVVDAAFELDEPGALSPVLETDQGLYLVRLVNHDPQGAIPLEKVRSGIRANLLRDKVKAARDRALAELAGEVEIETDIERVRALAPATEQTNRQPQPPRLPGEQRQ